MDKGIAPAEKELSERDSGRKAWIRGLPGLEGTGERDSGQKAWIREIGPAEKELSERDNGHKVLEK
ncbi:hypothetical protein J2TS4_33180 [Paenibacillus sp. J2TS4]|nr:hypothetical protein J2TS4_33180 [Paenibacillus sp. J2TS4]